MLEFSCTQLGGELFASSSAPQLRSISWHYSGGPYIEAGLAGGPRVSVVNVWDYKTDTARLAFTREALEQYLADHYSDPDTLEALLEEIAQS